MIETMSAQNGYFRKKDDTTENLAVKDGFHTTSTELNSLSEGLSYVSGKIFESIASGASAVVHFKTGSKISVMSYGVGSDGSCDYGLYKNPIITSDGTLFGSNGRNMVTVKESTAKSYHTPTVTSNGTVLADRSNGGASGPAKGGGTGQNEKIVILPPNTSVLIIAKNKSTTASRINIVLDWIEIE